MSTHPLLPHTRREWVEFVGEAGLSIGLLALGLGLGMTIMAAKLTVVACESATVVPACASTLAAAANPVIRPTAVVSLCGLTAWVLAEINTEDDDG